MYSVFIVFVHSFILQSIIMFVTVYMSKIFERERRGFFVIRHVSTSFCIFLNSKQRPSKTTMSTLLFPFLFGSPSFLLLPFGYTIVSKLLLNKIMQIESGYIDVFVKTMFCHHRRICVLLFTLLCFGLSFF